MLAVRRALVALLVASGALLPAGAQAGGVPTARAVVPVPTVAAVFAPSGHGLAPALHLPHVCSAEVLRTATGAVVLTAAHCVAGAGVGLEVAPGFHDGQTPRGTWDVTAVYVDPGWLHGQDPRRDAAVLVVAPRNGQRLGDVVRGERLGVPRSGRPVTVTGYPQGSDGRPVTCRSLLSSQDGYPRFDCHGFVGGTSGSPWVQRGRVVGVIGGLEQGGCTEMTSYSAPFGAWTLALVRRAETGAAADLAPSPDPVGGC